MAPRHAAPVVEVRCLEWPAISERHVVHLVSTKYLGTTFYVSLKSVHNDKVVYGTSMCTPEKEQPRALNKTVGVGS